MGLTISSEATFQKGPRCLVPFFFENAPSGHINPPTQAITVIRKVNVRSFSKWYKFVWISWWELSIVYQCINALFKWCSRVLLEIGHFWKIISNLVHCSPASVLFDSCRESGSSCFCSLSREPHTHVEHLGFIKLCSPLQSSSVKLSRPNIDPKMFPFYYLILPVEWKQFRLFIFFLLQTRRKFIGECKNFSHFHIFFVCTTQPGRIGMGKLKIGPPRRLGWWWWWKVLFSSQPEQQ